MCISSWFKLSFLDRWEYNNTNVLCSLDSSSREEQSSDEDHSDLESTLYNGDALTPVFSWKKEAFSHHDLVTILLCEHETEHGYASLHQSTLPTMSRSSSITQSLKIKVTSNVTIWVPGSVPEHRKTNIE